MMRILPSAAPVTTLVPLEWKARQVTLPGCGICLVGTSPASFHDSTFLSSPLENSTALSVPKATSVAAAACLNDCKGVRNVAGGGWPGVKGTLQTSTCPPAPAAASVKLLALKLS